MVGIRFSVSHSPLTPQCLVEVMKHFILLANAVAFPARGESSAVGAGGSKMACRETSRTAFVDELYSMIGPEFHGSPEKYCYRQSIDVEEY